ncbi:MAG: metallophosphoesterase [Ruminiclostridium sp.]|nr:metallophosphoesterase [Ruminiclostridium sp.]
MKRKTFIAVSAVLTALAVAIPFSCSEKLCERYYTFSSGKLTAPLKIAFLSDVHNTPYGEDMSELTEAVDKFGPDAVVFGGDLFDHFPDEKNSLLLVDILAKKYPCYYALGNHELRHGFQAKIRSTVAERGVTVLSMKNNHADLTVGNDTVRFLGIDGILYSDQYERAKEAISDKYYNILIDHFPEEYPHISADGFELILAGHTHGGQVRIPFLLNGLYAPNQGLFPKYGGGVYSENGSDMVVSRGLMRCAYDIIVPRVFNRPEIVFVTVLPK